MEVPLIKQQVLDEDITVLQNENKKVLEKLDEVEQTLKLNQVRVYGIAENTTGKIEDELKNIFDDKLEIKDVKIEYCHRIGQKNDTKPRPVLVKFLNTLDRNRIFFSKKKLKGSSKISITEELTKKRYELLVLAKEKLGKENVWSTGGKVFCNMAGAKKRLMSEEDVISISEEN